MSPGAGLRVPFAKLQGAGNAYLIIDGRPLGVAESSWPEIARAITDAHFGVGSDGIAVVADSSTAQLRMRIFNSDGSEAEMSGNGIRLFAKFVLDRGLAHSEGGVLRIETGGGVRDLWPAMQAGRMVSARVGMGAPRAPESGPVELELEGRVLQLWQVSIGNPHAVWIAPDPVDDFPLAELGPQVQSHRAFAQRVNFEVANVIDRGHLRARIFERGEGETLASGTGSTACVVAARRLGLVDREVAVSLRGGTLYVSWEGEGSEAMLEGPAVEVFEGVWRAPESIGN